MALPESQRLTFADMQSWPEDERVELIDGIPVMQAAPARIHQLISRRLLFQIGSFLEDKECEIYYAPFAVRLFESSEDRPEDVDTVVEPDLVVVCDKEKLDDAGCKGAPDLIIEILSPSTQRHDRMVKYNLYQRAGVERYWIVDPETKTVQVCTLEDGLYGAPQVYSRDDNIVMDNGCVVELGRVFA